MSVKQRPGVEADQYLSIPVEEKYHNFFLLADPAPTP